MSVRIIGGRFGGRRLETRSGPGTRPTTDRAREALFSILGPLDGAYVLDVFAGSGALGLEALSRGATAVTFVEHARSALNVIRSNIALLAVADETRVVAADWAEALNRERRAGAAFDLVLADPPYGEVTRIGPLLGAALVPLVRAGGRVVVEYSSGEPELPGLGPLQVAERIDRHYGATAIAIIEVDT